MRFEASPTGFSLTAIDERGRLFICGQTFLEGNEYVSRFVEVPQLPPVIRAAAGADRCAAVTADGRLFTWGGGPMPGDAAADPRCVAVNPKEVVFPRGEKVTDAAVGDLFSAALTASGRLYRWGETDGAGEGGKTATDGCLHAAVVEPGDAAETRLTAAVCGYDFAAAPGKDGCVYVWGRLPGTETIGDKPVRAEGIDDAQAVVGGCRHIAVLHRDGTVSAWGNGGDGRLGTGRFGDEPRPCRVVSPDGSGLLTGVVSLAAGAGHTAAVTGDGRLFVWGRNVGGVFGPGYRFGCESAVPLPVDVSLFGSRSVRKVYGGHDCLHVLLSDGSLCSWGLETAGEFGCGAAVPRITDVPQKAELPD